jgi:uncharacterized protein (DUF1778 family)
MAAGRKKIANGKRKNEVILCRMNHEQKELLRKAAQQYGLGMSYYIREILLKEATKELMI